MATYWYSTDGMDHKRLSSCHLATLDNAYERRSRVEIFDNDAFGPDMPAVADPYLGTMTAGDIHYGLYRNPSLRVNDIESLDMLMPADSQGGAAAVTRLSNHYTNPTSLQPTSTQPLSRQTDQECMCCIIS